MSHYSRRDSIKILGALPAASVVGEALADNQTTSENQSVAVPSSAPFRSTWHNDHDRIWLGSDVWANPMEDWKVVEGAAECVTPGGRRSVHLITHRLTDPAKGFAMSVGVEKVARGQSDTSVGFLIGVRSELNETKSNTFAQNGIPVGIIDGSLAIGPARKKLGADVDVSKLAIEVTGKTKGQPDAGTIELTLIIKNNDTETIDTITHDVPAERLIGNVAIANNFTLKPMQKKGGSRFRFADWRVSGDAFTVDPNASFGPILWTMYSLSDSRSDEGFVLKLSALTPPLGENDNGALGLQVRRDGTWKSMGTATLDRDAWTATFRIANWDASADVPFRVVYMQKQQSADDTRQDWTGTIKANPVGRKFKFAPLTCQHDSGFPYEPVAQNLLRLDPDLLYFSGDQIYEQHGGFGIIRDPAEDAIVNYLRKFYQFGWAFRESMRHCPTLCIPDDHDVFQGNVWGEGGAAMQGVENGASSKGGYREPVRMVNVVHKTCTAHHPDPWDAAPAQRGMSVYYGDMVYGDVSFAIIGDRQFKSGPEHVETGSGRADHVTDRNFDTSKLDLPGLELLGERQENFLRAWAEDWRGAKVKILLSQTTFAGVATHHGDYDGYLKADLDCGSWPQTARNRAIDLIRKSKALHVNGDQHLTSICQYGVRGQRDSNWSFCVPAISVGYPRWWRPDEDNVPHANRPDHGLANTGEYVDGFGNQVYVYAVGNPVVGKSSNRYVKAHEKGSGLGWILIDTEAETFECHSFRFLVDVTDGNPGNEFPGWPVTVRASDNSGETRSF